MSKDLLLRLLDWYSKDPGAAEALIWPKGPPVADALLNWYFSDPNVAEAIISEAGADDE